MELGDTEGQIEGPAAVEAGITVGVVAGFAAAVRVRGASPADLAHEEGEDVESTYARKEPVGTAFREGDADDE